MTKEVQLVGGDAENQNVYVGPARELTVDTSNQELRLHDGVTPGGHRFLNRDSNDERYQVKNPELGGFAGIPAQAKGFAVRVAPGSYRIRTLTYNADNILITNPAGTAGNPLISLAATIESAHTWNGLQTFTENIVATGGVTGDTTGTHTGDVVGNVTGNVDGNADGNHTGSFTGNLDTAGHTVNMGDGQIQLEWLSDEIQQLFIDRGVPNGAILAWSGVVGNIPTGWLLCDGSNGTPDLRNRFLLGAGGAYLPSATGGAANHTHDGTTSPSGAHIHQAGGGPHALTINEIPSHRHGSGATNDDQKAFAHGYRPVSPAIDRSLQDQGQDGQYEAWSDYEGGGQPHSHPDSDTSSSGVHTHDLDDMEAASNMPPYYALCYIMKGV